jgi:hypothetical protein
LQKNSNDIARKKEGEFVEYLKSEISKNPNRKPLQKEAKNGNSYKIIAEKKHDIPLRRFRELWEEATDNLPKNSIWKQAGRPKNNIKKS